MLADKDEGLSHDGTKGLQKFVAAIAFGILQHLVGHVQQGKPLRGLGIMQGVPPLYHGDPCRSIVVFHHGSCRALNGRSSGIHADEEGPQGVGVGHSLLVGVYALCWHRLCNKRSRRQENEKGLQN